MTSGLEGATDGDCCCGCAVDGDCCLHGTGNPDSHCRRALDNIRGVRAKAGVVKDEVVKDAVIEHGPSIGNRGSHNMCCPPHDNKRRP